MKTGMDLSLFKTRLKSILAAVFLFCLKSMKNLFMAVYHILSEFSSCSSSKPSEIGRLWRRCVALAFVFAWILQNYSCCLIVWLCWEGLSCWSQRQSRLSNSETATSCKLGDHLLLFTIFYLHCKPAPLYCSCTRKILFKCGFGRLLTAWWSVLASKIVLNCCISLLV